MQQLAIEDLYRDPRTAFGARARIPVGTATELSSVPPEFQRSGMPGNRPPNAPLAIDSPPPKALSQRAPGVMSRAANWASTTDIAPALKGIGRVIARGVPHAMYVEQVHDTATTPTSAYEARTGLQSNGKFLGDLGVRAAGTLQDIGNKVTFGIADRLGNALAGNGFVRSKNNQVGEFFGPGEEAGGGHPLTPRDPSPGGAGRIQAIDEGVPWSREARPAATPPSNANAITFDPKTNTYSGGGGIAEGAEIRSTNGSLRQGGGFYSSASGGIGEISEAHRQDLLQLARNRAEQQPASIAAGIGTGPGGSGYGLLDNEALRRRSLEMEISRTPSNLETHAASVARARSAANSLRDLNASISQRPAQAAQLEAAATTERAKQRNALDIANLSADRGVQVARIGADARKSAAETAADARAAASENAANARVAAAEAGAKRYIHMPGGDEVLDIGSMPTKVRRPDRIFDTKTGQTVEPQDAPTKTATPRAEYDKMPKGARYTGPDGKTYIKG